MYCATEILGVDIGDAAKMSPTRFKLVSRCTVADQRGSAEILSSVEALNPADQRAAIVGLRKLLKLSQLGRSLRELADGQIHEAFESFHCAATNRRETIWRYRQGKVRILFFYGKEKILLLTGAVAKRTDKLSNSDIASAKSAVEDYLLAISQSDGITWI